MSENGNKSDFLEECNEYFGSKNLYEILGIDKTANESEIKSAYRKKSLKVHPDRATEDRKEHAKRAFQALTKVHYILTTENLRKVYDETGMVITDEDSGVASFSTFEEFENYWRTLFPKISIKQIDEFLAKYVGSDEEKADLKKLYLHHEGDLDKIYEYHYAYDEDRVVELLNELVKAKEVPKFDAFVNEPKSKKQKRLKRIEKEAAAAEKEKKKQQARKRKAKKQQNEDEDEEDGDNDFGDISALQLAIQKKNQDNFNSFVSNLEAKYGSGKKNGGGRGGGKNKNKNKKARTK